MKKRLLSLLLALLLGLCLPGVTARADETQLVNLGSAEAGSVVDRFLGTTESGEAAVSEGELPDGCRIESETRSDGAYHYLRGTPTVADNYAFTLRVAVTSEEGEESVSELICSLTVTPAEPTVEISDDVECAVGETVTLEVSASAADAGELSYQWYVSDSRSDRNGALLSGETGAAIKVTPAAAGTRYYSCSVENTNNGRAVSVWSAAAAVTATAPQAVSLSVSRLPERTEFEQGEIIDTSGLELSLLYSDGSSAVIREGFSVTPGRLDTVGMQSVLITYEGLSCSYSVQVKEKAEQLLELQIVNLPAKLDYIVGDRLDAAGLTLRVETSKGSYDVATGYTCSPEKLETEGRQTITVNYAELSASFTVTVKSAEEQVESVAIARRPTRLSYTVGDYFDPLGLTLNVQTNRGVKEVSDGFTWVPQQFTAAGRQNVIISYEGRTVSLEIIVDAPTPTPSPEETSAPTQPQPTPEEAPATPRPDSGVPRRSGHTAVIVIVAAALVGLAALLAYVYLTKKERVLAWLQQMRERFGRK